MDLETAKKLILTLPKYLIPTGGIKRNHPIINDFDFLTLKPLNIIYDYFQTNFDNVKLINGKNLNKRLILLIDDFQFDFWFVPSKVLLPFFKLEYDLGMANIKYKKLARQKGYKLSVKGLTKNNVNYASKFKSIKDIINFLEK